MTAYTPEHLKQAVTDFGKARILVIGDIIVDHFIWGNVSRISPEAPVPVVNVTHDNLLLGGAANVLHNLFALGAKASLCGVVGEDAMGDQLFSLLADLGASTDGVVQSPNRPTTIKTRIIAQSQQVVRFDREKSVPLSPESHRKILAFLDRQLDEVEVIVISDYDKGMISESFMDSLRDRLRSRPRIKVVVDPKPRQPARFQGATLVTPNHHEAELMSGITITDEASLSQAAHRLQEMLLCEAVLITRGEAGMTLFERDLPAYTIPTVAKEVYDVTGAGDTVIATLALGLGVGLSSAEAATLANFAAGIVVGKIGTATATTAQLLEAIS